MTLLRTLLALTLALPCFAADKAPLKAPAASAPVPEEVTSEPLEKPAGPSSTASVNFKLFELFDVEKLPGAGILSFAFGDKVENAALGADSGYYALGLVFEGAGLPEQYGKDFRKNDIIQIAMGSMRNKLQGQIPQFGAATIIARGIPKRPVKFPFVVPSGKENALEEMAFLLVTSPTTPNERPDEEKLKGTYFAQSGGISFTPIGATRTIDAKSAGRRISFKMRIMKVTFDASLMTPFNAQPSSLKGTIELPLYWPNGKDARVLTQKIAAESLESSTTLLSPEGLTQHSRDVAGSTKKDTNRN